MGRSPTAVTFSPLSKAVYVSDSDAGQVAVIDGRKRKVVNPHRRRTRRRPRSLRTRGPLWLRNKSSQMAVYIFDAASNRLLHTVPVGKTPDQITFTKELRLRATGRCGRGRNDSLEHHWERVGHREIPRRTKIYFASRRLPLSLADAIVPTPEGNSVVVANTADRQIYYYTEGMAAPMGNFQNYRRDPRAVLVADRSLRETRTGVYEAVTRIPRRRQISCRFSARCSAIAHCFEAVRHR